MIRWFARLTILAGLILSPLAEVHVVAVPAAPSQAASRGTDHAAELAEVRRFIERGEYREALIAARQLLVLTERTHGADSVEAGRALDVLVLSLQRAGKATETETAELAERALSLKRAHFSSSHPEVAKSLCNLGNLHYFKADYERARALLQEALAMQEKALGPRHPDVAWSLNYLGIVWSDMGEFATAESLYRRSLEIREEMLGPDHLDVAWSLNGLANLFSSISDYARARPLYERALRIREEALGPEHPAIAGILHNLGILYYAMGDYAGARPLYERALEIRENRLEPSHPLVASTMNALATLLEAMGDYGAARPLYERSLAIWETTLGPKHPHVALNLNHLGSLLTDTGDDDGAKALFERALAIQQEVLDPENADIAWTLDLLARLRHRAGAYEEARALRERSLAIREKALGSEHPEVARALTQLGTSFFALGEYAKARPLYDRALQMNRDTLGPEHPRVAWTLNHLGNLLAVLGDLSGAQSLYRRAIEIQEKTYGPDYRDVAVTLGDLALVLARSGETAEASRLALRADGIWREHLRVIAGSSPERAALRYAQMGTGGRDLALSLAEHVDPASRLKVWDAMIRGRALVFDEMASRFTVVRVAAEIGRLAEAYSASLQRYANLKVRGPGGEPPERYSRMLEGARLEAERAERDLAQRNVTFQAEQERRSTGLTEVVAALPDRSVLVAFSHYNRYALSASAEPSHEPGTSDGSSALLGGGASYVPSYMAYVLRSGSIEPRFVVLGSADEIDSLVSRWKVEASSGLFLQGRSVAEAEAAYREAGERLRERIWEPIAPHVSAAERVLIVPDGALNLVSFAALPVGGDSYLVEAGPLIHYLSTERDVGRYTGGTAEGRGLLAMGGVQFDAISSVVQRSPRHRQGPRRASGSSSVAPGTRAGGSNCVSLEVLHFDELPASGREAEEIAGLWKRAHARGQTASGVARVGGDAGSEAVLHLTGAEASEKAFKEGGPGRRVLHLATHGFFLGGECGAVIEHSRGIGELAPAEDLDLDRFEFTNPLRLSGLALAGANRRTSASPHEEDGILTADEIATLNLDAAEWAVLSACDTGVGEVRVGEGVFGLRRAFQLAGVKTLIMSLWAVQDESARLWMKELYEARLLERRPTAVAVREASLRALRQRRSRNDSTHPFFWAGFVAVGDWR
jgi:tetratricopeptide (TPR) repeat protein/CHAT domain-containing protein